MLNGKFERISKMTTKPPNIKCPTCGRFVSEYEGFFMKKDPSDDSAYVSVFCDEPCADKWLLKSIQIYLTSNNQI